MKTKGNETGNEARKPRIVKMADHAAREAAKIVYEAAVARVANRLRARFESGELRGWMPGDGETRNGRMVNGKPPMWKIEDQCERLFLKSIREVAMALLVMDGPGFEEAMHDFERPEHIAAPTMALDVLHFARQQGWSKPLKGETPKFIRTAA